MLGEKLYLGSNEDKTMGGLQQFSYQNVSGRRFLSPYREREKFIIYPDKYCLLLSPHPFASVYIFFKVPGGKEIRKKSGKEDIPGYEADEQELREKFAKWGVEMDGV